MFKLMFKWTIEGQDPPILRQEEGPNMATNFIINGHMSCPRQRAEADFSLHLSVLIFSTDLER